MSPHHCEPWSSPSASACATRQSRTSASSQRERAGQHIPIIAMTAGALAEDRQRCLDAGMDDYLAKPIDPQQLYAALSRWITAAASTPSAGSDSR